jgi:2-isopropylmalate synthase
MEEVVMALKTRRDYFEGLDTRIKTTEIYPTSRLLSSIIGVPVQPNKAIVGDNAFAHEAGIHQHGVLQAAITYEIMTPQSIGRPSNELVLGKHSGRHALREALNELGFKVEGQALNHAFTRFKEIADRKKNVTALDLEAIVSDEVRERSERYNLAWFDVEASSRREPRAKVAVTLPSGEQVEGEASGDGPVDSIFGAIQKATDVECELRQYTVSAVTEGGDALGEVTVMLRAAGRLASGQGVSTDILEASARAYVRALSNALDGAAIREAEAATADAATQPATPGP